MGKLIVVLEESQYDNVAIQTELDSFINEPKLNINLDGSDMIDNKALSQYIIIHQNYVQSFETLSIKTERYILFNSTREYLDDRIGIVTAKSLKYLDHFENFLCLEKEIYLYNEYRLNDHNYIIKFCGYSI